MQKSNFDIIEVLETVDDTKYSSSRVQQSLLTKESFIFP